MARYVSNGIAHFDIAGPELAALGAFYGGVFGWSVTERGPGYASVATPSGSPDGALVEQPVASFVIGVVVPNLEDALQAAVAHGGSIAMPITDNGWVTRAQIADPAGNTVTIIKG